jgi:NADH-quinone oxidoreductase subunit G
MRVMPRENDDVNEIWLCDKGRMGMRFMESATRVTTPLVRQHGKLVPASWDEALTRIATNLGQIAANGNAHVAGMISDSASNEDLFAFGKLVNETFGSQSLDHRPGTAYDTAIDTAIGHAGVGLGTNLTTLGKGTAVIVVAADVEEEAPLYVLRLRGIQNRGGAVHVVNSYATKLGTGASSDTRLAAGGEAAFVAAFVKQVIEAQVAAGIDRRVRNLDELRSQVGKQSLESLCAQAGVSAAQLQKVVDAYMAATNSIIVYGKTALQIGGSVTTMLANAALATGKAGKANNGLIALTLGANTAGAVALGITPGKGGAAASEYWAQAEAGTLRGLLVVGLDPAAHNPAAVAGIQAISKHGFVAVQTMFMNATAELADVVLPQMAIAETDGTITNTERRVQRFRIATAAPAAMHPTWQICSMVAERVAVGKPTSGRGAVATSDWGYAVTSDVTEEIAATVPVFKGITYTSLDLSIKSWGRQANESFYYDGTSYTNTEGNGVQLATTADNASAALNLQYVAAAVYEPKGEFTLLMQNPARAYNGGTWSIDSKLGSRQVPSHALVSTADAARWNINGGDQITVTSPVGSSTLVAQVDKNVATGHVLIPDVAGAPLQLALGAYTRVAIRRAE